MLNWAPSITFEEAFIVKQINPGKALCVALIMGAAMLTTTAMADPMQGGHSAYGMSRGMMGNYGENYSMGNPMMGGYGHSGAMGQEMMGQGMMGAYGMSPNMMGNPSLRPDLKLTAEQRNRIAKIREEVRRKHWDLMGKMQDEQAQMNEQYNANKRDDAAVSKSYRQISEFRHQMFDLSLSAESQIDAVLTPEQREKQKQD